MPNDDPLIVMQRLTVPFFDENRSRHYTKCCFLLSIFFFFKKKIYFPSFLVFCVNASKIVKRYIFTKKLYKKVVLYTFFLKKYLIIN